MRIKMSWTEDGIISCYYNSTKKLIQWRDTDSLVHSHNFSTNCLCLENAKDTHF